MSWSFEIMHVRIGLGDNKSGTADTIPSLFTGRGGFSLIKNDDNQHTL